MFGKGLATGLSITLKEMFKRKVTIQYPFERPELPERFHGRFVLDREACIACGLCESACPNRVITVSRTKVDKKNVLTGYRMDIQYCLFCGLCVEACPRNAIRFSKDFEMAVFSRENVPLTLLAESAGAPAVDPGPAGEEANVGD